MPLLVAIGAVWILLNTLLLAWVFYASKGRSRRWQQDTEDAPCATYEWTLRSSREVADRT